MFKKDKKPDNNIKIGFKSNSKAIISLCQKYFKEKIFNEIHLSAVGGSIGNLVTIAEIVKILVPDLYQQNRISTVTYQSVEEGTELKELANQKLFPKFDITFSLEKPKEQNEGFQDKLTEEERKKILDVQSKIKEDKKNKKKVKRNISGRPKSRFNKKKKIINRRGNSAFNRRKTSGKFETKKRTSFRKRFRSVSNKKNTFNGEKKFGGFKKNSLKKNYGANFKKTEGDKKNYKPRSLRYNPKKTNDGNTKYNGGARRTPFNRFGSNGRKKINGFNKFNGGNRNFAPNTSSQKIKN